MYRYRILGIVNCLLSIFFAFTIASSGFGKEPLPSLDAYIQTYVPYGILLFLLVMNAVLAYKLLLKKEEKLPLHVYLILTFSTLFWFILLFVGYFFASSVIFPVLVLALIVAIYYFLRKSSKKIATMLSVVTLVVVVVVIISSFEEDYCWGKSIEADNSGSKMVVATKEDSLALKGFEVKEGTQIGVGFKAHMLCHDTFKLTDALKERYSFAK